MPEKKKFTPRLKYYHLFLLSIIFCPILILNSNYANKKRLENKLNEEAKKKFERIVFGRRLAEDEDEDEEDNFPEDTEKVCKKGSDNQKDYYKTGDGSKIGIKDDAISSEDRPDYINNLIDIIKSSTSDSGEGEIDMKEKLTPYIKHLFPVIFFLAVTILAIPGWIVCCSCCCANCCCCYCCKKQCCRLPFFIITYACYAIVFFVSIYGLSQSNSIFVGLADTECSLLKFVGDVVYGENKETTPKWGGIENIKTKLDLTSEQFQIIKDSKLQDLKNEKERIKNFEPTFRNELKRHAGLINNELIKNEEHSKYLYNGAALDLAYDFGTFNSTDFPSKPNTFVNDWVSEYYNNYMQSFLTREGVVIGLEALTGGSDGGVMQTFKDAKQPVDDIKGSIDGVKDQISDIIVSYSDAIDEYGKLGFKIVFSVLVVFVAAIAAIMLLLCFCSGKTSSKCCCFRCGFRIILHILWNFLALLMILTFLIGTIFILVGTIGSDLVEVVSYVVSPENLNKGNDAALLGGAASILTKCLNGDGDISEDLNIGSDTEELLENLKSNKTQIDNLIRNYQVIQNNNSRVSKIGNKKIAERVAYSNLDFGFKDSNGYKYKLKDAIDNINNVNDFEVLSFHCPNDDKLECDASSFQETTPKKCYPLNDCKSIGTRYSASTKEALVNSASTNGPIIEKIISAQEVANSDDSEPGIKNAIDKSEAFYETFLTGEITGLGAFSNCIGGITGIYDDWVNENDRFLSFLNCKFMGKNIRVVLKFLGKSLGGHFKTVGICLLLSGFSLAIAIIFTILLMSILKENAGK